VACVAPPVRSELCLHRTELLEVASKRFKGSAGEEFSAERESAGSSRTQEPRDQVGSSRTIPPRAGTSSEWINPAGALRRLVRTRLRAQIR